MYVPRYQRGISIWAAIAILLLVIGTAIVAIRVGPPIVDHIWLMRTLENLHTDSKFDQAPVSDVKRALNTRLNINNLDYLRDVVVVRQVSGKVVFQVDYIVERPLVGNAYIVLKYNEQLGP